MITIDRPEHSSRELKMVRFLLANLSQGYLTRLFADDSSLFYSAATTKDIEDIINHDLRILVSWAAQLLISLNPFKTEVMLFTLRLTGSLPNIIFDGTPINLLQNSNI